MEIDGLTTNGVLIMHPKGQFCGGKAKCGVWRECSVGGDIFNLRESRSAQQKGKQVSDFHFALTIGRLMSILLPLGTRRNERPSRWHIN